MSHGNGFTDGLTEGLVFGGLLGAADRINRQAEAIDEANATILDLAARHNQAVADLNRVIQERNAAIEDRDLYKCGLEGRKVEIEFLIGQVCKEAGWAPGSKAEAELRDYLERIRDARYRDEMHALGYKLKSDVA